MHVNRSEGLSRMRSERQSAPSTVSRDRAAEKREAIRARKERAEPLRGWKTSNLFPDTDFTTWAQRKEAIDLREGRSFANKREWDPYVCTLLRKCRAIENIEDFVSQSLSISLKPPAVEKEVKKVPLKHARSENFAKSKEYAQILEEVSKPNGLDLLKEGIEKEIKAAENSVKTGSVPPNGAKITKLAHLKSSQSIPEVENETESKSVDKDPSDGVDALPVDDVRNDTPDQSVHESYCDSVSFAGGLSSRKSEVGELKGQEVKQPPPKFGYTQANRNDISAIYNNENSKKSANETGPSLRRNNTENAEYETISEISNYSTKSQKQTSKAGIVKRTLQATSVSLAPGFQTSHGGHKNAHKIYSMSRSETNIKELKDEPQIMTARRLDDDVTQSLAGMSIASIKTARRVGSSQSDLPRSQHGNFHSQSYQDISTQDETGTLSQKQVMLVLKKVTLQDDDLDQAAENANGGAVKRNALTSAIARKYGLLTNGVHPDSSADRTLRALSGKTNKTVPTGSIRPLSGDRRNDNDKITSGRGSNFPIGDLLPAVDSSIRNSMPARHYRSTEHYGTGDRDMSVTGKDKMLPYEDSTIMMKEGIELLRMREREGTLGPQGFRAQHGKTPLHRAKENAHKRLYTQLEPKAVQNGDVGNRARWESSKGHLYNASNSRPSSVNPGDETDKSRDRGGELSRKFNSSASEVKKASGRAINVENGKIQMQHVSKALASRLHDLARQQTHRENVHDLLQRAGVK